MQKVIKVKFRNSSRCYYFDALDFDIHDGMSVIVNTTHGDMLGTASGSPTVMDETRLSNQLKPVLRIATEEDMSQMRYYHAKESEALNVCRSKIEAHGLNMKLVDAEYAFNGSKLTFYFTAESRVDFRELLKDLTAAFKVRIDLRQIGDRDEAKKCGGLGFCGRPVCCNTFLSEFTPVSIKMAKTQNLSLNPLKISGICGKLMCCLRYEQEAYESMQKVMPSVGKEFITPDGPGIVLENNVITETTKLKITLPDGTFDVRSYPFRELTSNGGGCCGECMHGEPAQSADDAHSSETAPHSEASQTSDATAQVGKNDSDQREVGSARQQNGKLKPSEQGDASSAVKEPGGSANKPDRGRKYRRFNGSHQRKQTFRDRPGGGSVDKGGQE